MKSPIPSFASLFTTALAVASVVKSSPIFSAHPNSKRSSNANSVAIYWGQAPNQITLSQACSDTNVDIVILAFVNVFPDQGPGGWPGTNFGNACGGATYTNNGASTDLLSSCPGIETGIDQCQANGKKVLLSIGGAYPGNYYLANATSAQFFANFLWGAFGPNQNTGSPSDYPRPFGNAVVDGFDLDIESTAVTTTQKQQYYPDFITQLRNNYKTYTNTYGGSYYVSAAPQCIVPDAHFSNYIQTSWFDYIFVQLYNTAQCSAAANLAGTADNSWKTWLTQTYSGNSNVKIYAGLPASTTASTGDSSGSQYYLTPSQVQSFVNAWYSVGRFSGISLWDATYSAGNTQCGQGYSYWVKKALNNAGGSFSTACPSSSSSSTSVPTSSVPVSSSSSFTASSTSSTISRSSMSSSSTPTSSTQTSSSAISTVSSTSSATSKSSTSLTRATTSSISSTFSSLTTSTSTSSSRITSTSSTKTTSTSSTKTSSSSTKASSSSTKTSSTSTKGPTYPTLRSGSRP